MRGHKKKEEIKPHIKIFSVIGILTVLSIVTPIFLNSIIHIIPLSFKHYERMETSETFNSQIIQGDGDGFYDYERKFVSAARTIYDELGIQMYMVSVTFEEPLQTKEEGMAYALEYIKDQGIWQPNGMYIIQTNSSKILNYGDYGWDAIIYNEVIYGEDTANYLDSNMMRIYSAAYKKIYDSWFKVASTDEAILYGMEMMAERCMNPVRYIVRALFVTVGQLAVVIIIIMTVHKRKQERITQEILETPIKDIHDEKVEELLDRYDVY